MNALLIILLIIGVVIFFVFVNKISKRSTRIGQILTKYPFQVSTLCGTKVGVLTSDSKKTVLSFPFDNWFDWKTKQDELISLSKSFAEVMSSYILNYFPLVKNSPHYNDFKIFDPAVNRCKILIECLQYDEILKLSQISREEWSKRNENKAKAEAIALSNPDAIKELLKKDPSIMDDDIIKHQKRIEQIQKRHVIASAFDEWLKKQDDFCKSARNLRDDYAKNCGCYTYDVEFEKPLLSGKTSTEKFKIWQLFYASMSPHFLQYQSPSQISLYNKLDDFRCQRIYYANSVYDNIIPYIEALSKDKSIIVLFNKTTSYNWNIQSYDYHYDYFSGILSDYGIEWLDVEDLSAKASSLDYDIAIIFDFITTNSDLLYISKMIIESFSNNIPTIVWYSMIKEFDESESRELCKRCN